jgi:hypothetical protein
LLEYIDPMDLKTLRKLSTEESSKRLINKHDELSRLMALLRNRDLPENLKEAINHDVEGINFFTGPNKELLKRVRSAEIRILRRIEKEEKLVPKNAYRTRWMAIGMSVFGIPIGVAFGASLGNMAFLAIGIPMGMSIGIALGASMDSKANKEGRQLDIEISQL